LDEIHAPLWKNYVNALKTSLVYPIGQEDTLIWSFNPSGGYAPKFGYSSLILEQIVGPPSWWRNLPWKLKCLTKSKLFMWLLLHQKDPTWENLQKINFVGPSRCALCKQDFETNSHLFLNFTFTCSVWDELQRYLGPQFGGMVSRLRTLSNLGWKSQLLQTSNPFL
jgi:hypothetical protein